MIQLKENQGIPRSILLMMAIVAGLTVANCYYNQPLLELIRHDLDITEQKANLITVITQIGYALGLFFLIPLGDMLSRKKLILVNMTIAALMAIVMAAAQNVLDALGSFTADWRLFGDSAVLHSDSRTVFGAQEQEQEYGHCTLRTADGHSRLTSNQRLHRRMAGMAGDVYHSCFRDGVLHGNHAADDA